MIIVDPWDRKSIWYEAPWGRTIPRSDTMDCGACGEVGAPGSLSVGDVSNLAIRLPCEPSGGTRSGIYVGVFGSCGTEVDAGEGRR